MSDLVLLIPIGMLGLSLYSLHRSIEAYFAAQQALWNAKIALTMALIEESNGPRDPHCT